MAENDLKTTLLQTVFAVESAYWEYVYRIETLKVERQSLGLAEALLDKSRQGNRPSAPWRPRRS